MEKALRRDLPAGRFFEGEIRENDCKSMAFVKNTQTLFEKSKTDVQGAENPDMKQIDMAESTKCDKIKPDMRSCVHDTDRKQQ